MWSSVTWDASCSQELHHSGQQDGKSNAHPSLLSRQVELHPSRQQDGKSNAHPSLPSRQVKLHHNRQQDGKSNAHPSLISRQVHKKDLHPSRIFRSLESLVEGHNWFLNQFVEIPRRSIIVCFSSLSAKAVLNLPPFEISCS